MLGNYTMADSHQAKHSTKEPAGALVHSKPLLAARRGSAPNSFFKGRGIQPFHAARSQIPPGQRIPHPNSLSIPRQMNPFGLHHSPRFDSPTSQDFVRLQLHGGLTESGMRPMHPAMHLQQNVSPRTMHMIPDSFDTARPHENVFHGRPLQPGHFMPPTSILNAGTRSAFMKQGPPDPHPLGLRFNASGTNNTQKDVIMQQEGSFMQSSQEYDEYIPEFRPNFNQVQEPKKKNKEKKGKKKKKEKSLQATTVSSAKKPNRPNLDWLYKPDLPQVDRKIFTSVSKIPDIPSGTKKESDSLAKDAERIKQTAVYIGKKPNQPVSIPSPVELVKKKKDILPDIKKSEDNVQKENIEYSYENSSDEDVKEDRKDMKVPCGIATDIISELMADERRGSSHSLNEQHCINNQGGRRLHENKSDFTEEYISESTDDEMERKNEHNFYGNSMENRDAREQSETKDDLLQNLGAPDENGFIEIPEGEDMYKYLANPDFQYEECSDVEYEDTNVDKHEEEKPRLLSYAEVFGLKETPETTKFGEDVVNKEQTERKRSDDGQKHDLKTDQSHLLSYAEVFGLESSHSKDSVSVPKEDEAMLAVEYVHPLSKNLHVDKTDSFLPQTNITKLEEGTNPRQKHGLTDNEKLVSKDQYKYTRTPFDSALGGEIKAKSEFTCIKVAEKEDGKKDKSEKDYESDGQGKSKYLTKEAATSKSSSMEKPKVDFQEKDILAKKDYKSDREDKTKLFPKQPEKTQSSKVEETKMDFDLKPTTETIVELPQEHKFAKTEVDKKYLQESSHRSEEDSLTLPNNSVILPQKSDGVSFEKLNSAQGMVSKYDKFEESSHQSSEMNKSEVLSNTSAGILKNSEIANFKKSDSVERLDKIASIKKNVKDYKRVHFDDVAKTPSIFEADNIKMNDTLEGSKIQETNAEHTTMSQDMVLTSQSGKEGFDELFANMPLPSIKSHSPDIQLNATEIDYELQNQLLAILTKTPTSQTIKIASSTEKESASNFQAINENIKSIKETVRKVLMTKAQHGDFENEPKSKENHTLFTQHVLDSVDRVINTAKKQKKLLELENIKQTLDRNNELIKKKFKGIKLRKAKKCECKCKKAKIDGHTSTCLPLNSNIITIKMNPSLNSDKKESSRNDESNFQMLLEQGKCPHVQSSVLPCGGHSNDLCAIPNKAAEKYHCSKVIANTGTALLDFSVHSPLDENKSTPFRVTCSNHRDRKYILQVGEKDKVANGNTAPIIFKEVQEKKKKVSFKKKLSNFFSSVCGRTKKNEKKQEIEMGLADVKFELVS